MAAVGGISLFTSGRGGNIRARWGKGKRNRVDWNTGTKDPDEALRRAAEELRRRTGASAASSLGTPTPSKPAAAVPPSPQPPAVAPPPETAAGSARRPLGDALARVLGTPPAPEIASPAPAVVPDEVIDPGKVAAAELEDVAAKKAKHVHKVLGKGGALAIDGVLQRLIRFAGREPEEMDEDETRLITEGWEEIFAEWFGKKKLTPWGKVAAGSAVAGIGMYMAGKPLPEPKPAPAPLQLVPAQRPAAGPPPPAPPAGRDGGDGA